VATCCRSWPPAIRDWLVGFLHGVWHLPLMLLTTAYNPVGNRLIVVPLFLAVLTAAGVLYGYLRNESGSLWPVVIAHGTFNAVLGVLAGAAVADNPTLAAYLTGETGVFTLLAVVIVAWVLMKRSATKKEDQLVVQREPSGVLSCGSAGPEPDPQPASPLGNRV